MKMTVNILSEKINIIEKQIKVIDALKKKVEENEIEIMKLKQHDHVTKTGIDSFACKMCASHFPSKTDLKKHRVEVHPSTLNCKICEKMFQKNHQLETHMDEHKVEKKYKCDICRKSFYLEWRMNKHKSVHLESTRMCKYFGMKEVCPFEQVGCKFKHELSSKPPVTDNKGVEQNEVNRKDDEQPTVEEKSENIQNNKDTTNDNSVKEYQFECAYCAFKTDEYNPFMLN